MTPYEQLLAQTRAEETALPTSTAAQQPTVIDGDTLRSIYGQPQRLLGFDTLESFTDTAKAQKLAEEYGLDPSTQQEIGNLGKDRLQELIASGQYNLQGTETDFYGRPLIGNEALSEDMITSGYAVPTDRYNTKLQNVYRASQEKKDNLYGSRIKEALASQRDYNLDATKPTVKQMLGESIDALQAGTVKLLTDTGDFVLDVATFWGDGNSTLLDEAKKQENIDKWVGYDRREAEFRIDETLHQYKQGNYVEGTINMLPVAPQIFAESLPMMLGMVFGAGKFTALGKAMNAAKTAAEATRMKNMATIGEKMKYAVADNAGFSAVFAGQTNNRLEERQANQMGADLSPTEVAGVMAEEFLMLGLDKFAFEKILGINKGKKAILDLVKLVPDNAKAKLAAKLAESSGRIVGAVGAEAGQEFVQEFGNSLGAEYNTAKYGDDIITEERIEQATKGAIAGGAAGGFARSGAEVSTGIKKKAVVDKIKKEAKPRIDEVELNEAQQAKMDELKKGSIYDLTEDQRTEIDNLAEVQEPTAEEGPTPEEQQEAMDINTKIEEMQAGLDNVTGDEKVELETEIGKLEERLNEVDPNYVVSKNALDEAVTILKDRGESQDYIDTKTEEMKKVLKIAGLDKTIDIEDRKAGLKVEFDESARTAEAGGIKSKTFDPYNTGNDVLQAVVDGDYTVETAQKLVGDATNTKITESSVNHLKEDGKSQTKIKEVYNKIKEAVSTGKGKEQLSEISEDMSTNDVLRAMAIVMSNVSKNLVSEKYVQKNKGMKAEDVASIDYARESTMLSQIGKEYLNTMGIKYAGSPETTNLAYAKLGKKLVDYAKAVELVATESGKVPIVDMVAPDGSNINTKADFEKYYSNKSVSSVKDPKTGRETLYMVDNKLRLPDTEIQEGDPISKVGEAMTRLTAILLPTNTEIVKTEASTEVYIDENRPPAKGQKEMIGTIQSGGFSLKDGIRGLLQQMVDLVGDMTIDEAFAKDPIIKDMLGVKYMHSFLTKSNEKGQTINRKNTLRSVLDNLDNIPERYFFTYKTAINDRIHVQETMLEFQGDKRMSRNIQSGGEYTTQNELEYNELVKAIAEDSGLDTSIIVDSGKDSTIDKWVQLLGKNDGVLSIKDITKLNTDMGKNNPWKAYSLIKAIYAVRNRDGIKVSTDYAVEFDMTASGVFNTLMNLSGDPRVQEVLNQILDGNKDPYSLLTDIVTNETEIIDGKKVTVQDTVELNKIIKRLDNIGIDQRDLAKYLVMKWFYGSAQVQGDMANDLSVDVVTTAMGYNSDAIAEVNMILDSEYTVDTIHNITNTEFNKIKSYYDENVASKFSNGLDKAFPGVKEYRKKMTDIFTLLEKTGQWDGKIGTAIAAMNKDTDPKHKTTVKKKKATMVQMPDGTPVPVNKMFNNMASFFVNLQHLTDAYLNHKTSSDTIKKYGNGLMTVHDAIYGNIRDLIHAKGIYDSESVNVALDYDYVDTALNELKTAIDNMPDGVDKTRYTKAYNKMKADNAKMVESKVKYLKDKKINMFGSKTAVTTEVVPETETTVDIKPTISKEVKTSNEAANKAAKSLLEIMSSIRSKNINKVISKIENLEVSIEMVDLKNKVVDGLKKGVWIVDRKVDNTKVKAYGGQYGTIYVPTKNTLHPVTGQPMSIDEFVEVMAHEMDHALHFGYISNNMNSSEIKYLLKVVEQMKTKKDVVYSKNTQIRVDYILNPIDDNQASTMAKKLSKTVEQIKDIYRVSEFVSIMRNEKSVYNEIIEKEVGRKGLAATIQKILDRIAAWVAKQTPEAIKSMFTKDTEVTFKNTAIALASFDHRQNIYEAAQKEGIELDPPSMSKPKGKSNYSKQQDVYKDVYMNPDKYAEAVIARTNSYLSGLITIYGSAIIKVASPIAGKVHGDLKKNSDIYKKTAGYLRYGFIDSNTAQSMRRMFNVQSDVNESLLEDMLTLGTNIQSEVNDYLTVNLPDLDNRLKKTLDSKEQEVAYYLFSKTSIAGIQYNNEIVEGLINGTITIDEAYNIATKDIDEATMNKIKDLANQYVKGESKNGWVNHIQAELYDDIYKPAIALEAMKIVKDGQKLLDKMKPAMKKELYGMALNNQHLNDEVNGVGVHNGSNPYRDDFDGTYSMDVYDENGMQFVRVSKAQMLSDEYSSEKGWRVIKEPISGVKGIVARTYVDNGNVPGVGININRYDNGVYLDEEDSKYLTNKLNDMSEQKGYEYLRANNISVDSGSGRYKVLLTEAEKTKAGIKKSVADSLWRTYAHNAELTMMKSVRDLITESAIEKISNKDQLDKLNKKIAGNRDKAKKEILPMFIKINYDYKSYDDLPAFVKRYYVVPKNVTTYNNFNQKITLVKRGEKEVLVGHPSFNLFSEDNREMRKFMYGYKKLVVMAKQKMVLTNPQKLLMDAVANTGVLLSKDVPLMDIVRGIPRDLKLYNEFSHLRGEIVQLKLKANLGGKEAENRLKAAENRLRKHPFYNSYIYGHIQSYSTAMVTKDFDTVSGLQKDIDDIVNSITTDKKGNPNSIYNAIKWWQELGADKGFTVDSLFRNASEMSKVKGTSIGEELNGIAERLKADKNADSVSRYVSQIIGGPASEAVKLGGAVMISADVISKRILADHLKNKINPETGKKYTVEEAYREANRTFIDYRQNMPEVIKILSDHGILMFPTFWMKAQKVIANLIYHHPATSLSGYAIADMLDINSASFLDVNLINRIIEGRVLNNPTNLIDWDIFSIF